MTSFKCNVNNVITQHLLFDRQRNSSTESKRWATVVQARYRTEKMSCLSIVLGFLLFFQCVSAGDMTSFLSVNAQRYINPVESNQVNRLAELLLLSNAEEPLIVLQFDNFDLLGQFDKKHAQTYPFLATLFETSLEPVLQEDDVEYLSNGFDHAHVITVGEIPSSASDLLRHEFTKRDNAVVVQFTKDSYDVAELDDFLETVYAFMEDSMKNIDNIVLRVPSSNSANAESLRTSETSKDVGVDDPEVEDPEDSDALSSLWTEGLLSCLIVSGLLLAILVTALSWLASLDISYGALEKTTNPLKKNN